jgi:hypothetical protein
MDRRPLTLATGTFAVGTDAFVIAGVLPQVAESLRAPMSSAGQLVTAYALGYGVLSPVLAAATGGRPRKRVLRAGLMLFVVGNVATAALPSFLPILVSRVVARAGGAMYTPAALASVAGSARRARAMAVVMAGLSASRPGGDRGGPAVRLRCRRHGRQPRRRVGDRPVRHAPDPPCRHPRRGRQLRVATAVALAAFGTRGIGPAGAVLVAIGLNLAELPAKEQKHARLREKCDVH